ncbi:flagellar hook-basal body complex protein FliE [Lachnospiraceae bacterium C1.1]|nr:flagellar hook-basal body complex protein FliE [Lachnospiraceae bacterium C1.1]
MDIGKLYNVSSPIIGQAELDARKAEGISDGKFASILDAAKQQLDETNSYLNNEEEEEVKFALGLTDNAHDLAIAQAKAKASLQYTVALRDKFLEAYKEIIQIQM